MKKYLKLLVLVIVFGGLPLVIDFSILHFATKVKWIQSMGNVTPTFYFGIFDPVSVIALFLLVKFILKRDPLKFSNVNRISLSNSVLSILLGLFMGAFTISLMNINYVKTNIPQLAGAMSFILGGNVLLLVYIVAVNSIYKEFCFRGLIFNELKNNTPLIVAIICQALVYTLEIIAQMDPFSALYAFVGQVLFGLIFYYSRSIWGSVLAQFACTYGMVVIRNTACKNIFTTQSSAFLFPFSVIVVIGLLWVLYRNNKSELGGQTSISAASK